MYMYMYIYIYIYMYTYMYMYIYMYIYIYMGRQPSEKSAKRDISLSLAKLEMYHKNIHRTRRQAGGL